MFDLPMKKPLGVYGTNIRIDDSLAQRKGEAYPRSQAPPGLDLLTRRPSHDIVSIHQISTRIKTTLTHDKIVQQTKQRKREKRTHELSGCLNSGAAGVIDKV
jgi:hypothetical protein